MASKIIATAALLVGTAWAQGSAIVVNQCSYPVYIQHVPASGGGASIIGPNTLSTGQSSSQVYTQLTNGDGWSIKLATTSSFSPVQQYEYTYQNDGTIWFDMSDVNGAPFGTDWSFSGSDGCVTKNTAYQFPTDDVVGMQSCDDSASITLTLCGSGSGDSGASSSAWSSATSAATSSPSAASTASAASTGSTGSVTWAGHNAAVATPSTTLATSTKSGVKTVTNIDTVIATAYVTARAASPAANARRHVHRHAQHDF